MLTIFAKRTMALSFATDTELSFAKQKKAKFSFAKTCQILIRKNMSYSHSQKHVKFSFAKTCHILIRKNMSNSHSQKHVIFSFAKTCHIFSSQEISPNFFPANNVFPHQIFTHDS
jgi:predicted nucleic acid-binding protein